MTRCNRVAATLIRLLDRYNITPYRGHSPYIHIDIGILEVSRSNFAQMEEKYNAIDLATGKLNSEIFSNEVIYQEELEKIFGRSWLMIGHESLIPKVNDFFHTYMGEDPVILTRDTNNRLRACLSMCRHRGYRIVRTDLG